MMRIGRLMVLLGSVAGFSVPAFAEEPYYFHKAGVTRAAYLEDVDYCAGLSGVVRSPDYNAFVVSSNIAVSAVGSFMGAFFATLAERKARRRLVSRIERTCMGDKGYALRSIDKPTHRAIAELQGEAKIDRVFTLVASDNPVGKVLVE